MSRKKDYLTFISVVSAVAVLTLHTNGCFWFFSPTEMYWKTANIIECVDYYAVPLFFMLSGISLIDYSEKYSTKTYFIRRIRKTVIPFVAWSLIGALYSAIQGQVSWSQLNLRVIYEGIVNTEFIPIFWFFNSLFIIYLCMPLFSAVDKSKRKEVFSYLVIGGFVVNILLPFVCTVFFFGLSFPYSIKVVAGALYWIPFGWLMDRTEFSKKQRALIYFFAFIGLLMHIVGTYVLSMKAGAIISTFKGYENLPCVLYTAGMFVLLKQIGKKVMVGKIAQFVNWLGQYTFPIYLMQAFLLWEFSRLPFVDTYSIVYRLGAPFVMIPIIIIITAGIRKIPFLRIIVP